jgi:glycerophosphoryl diester phosphodiesterase
MICIAHRGASAREPENTLRAFDAALALGVDAVELDVHLVHGHLVVVHDARVDRTTNGRGPLTDFTFDRLRKLDAGLGERIPTLEEVVDLVCGRARLIVELKGPDTLGPVVALVQGLVRAGTATYDQFLISSFDHRAIERALHLAPDLPRAPLVQGVPLGLAAFAEPLRPHSIHISHEFVPPELVEDAHRRGYRVFVYTVNDRDEIDELRTRGVDGVFTDDPALMMRA